MMTITVRRLVAIPIGAIAAFLLALGVIDLWIAAFGDTGDTSRQVPLVFGLLFLAPGIVFGIGSVVLWRRAGP
jgi:hypothetical protein